LLLKDTIGCESASRILTSNVVMNKARESCTRPHHLVLPPDKPATSQRTTPPEGSRYRLSVPTSKYAIRAGLIDVLS
jgi:hypothetical protein